MRLFSLASPNRVDRRGGQTPSGQRGIRPTWPLPGGLVGGTFLVAIGLLPLMMTSLRLNVFDWEVYGWQQTAVYGLIALCSTATLLRWWRKGLEDTAPWDGATDRRSGRDRRRQATD